MKTQLKVIKTDGHLEEYLHTKIIGTINNALGRIGQPDIGVAEQLAEVVTYYLYRNRDLRGVPAAKIFSIIKMILMATRYEEAAVALNEHHLQRKLKRARIEVVSINIEHLSDAEALCGVEKLFYRTCWDKSRIVDWLITNHGICRQTARMIASMVEEKVFSMGITLVPASLIKQLVLGDAALVLRAERQLENCTTKTCSYS